MFKNNSKLTGPETAPGNPTTRARPRCWPYKCNCPNNPMEIHEYVLR